jgi:hypothetical protein
VFSPALGWKETTSWCLRRRHVHAIFGVRARAAHLFFCSSLEGSGADSSPMMAPRLRGEASPT